MKNVARYIKPVIGYFLAMAVLWIVVPTSYQLAPYKVDMKDGRILPGNIATRPFRLVAQPSDFSAQHQLRPRQTSPRQFHFKFDENWPVDGPRKIYIPSTGSETRVYINGVPISQDPNTNPFVPGLGRTFVQHELPRWIMIPGLNRLDVYVHKDGSRTGLREIYIGPSDEVARSFNFHSKWAAFIPIVAAIGSGLVVLIAIAGFMFGAQHKTYLFIGLTACSLLYQSMLSLVVGSEAIDPMALLVRYLFPLWILFLLYLIYVADKREWTFLQPYKAAFFAFAVTGPILAFSATLLPFLLPGSIAFASLMLCGALPLLFVLSVQRLGVDLSERRSQVEKLRAQVSQQEEELDEKGHALALEMRNRAVLEERQRFTRDIHDGIGGQLLSLILKVRTGKLTDKEIVSELQAGLNDLRLVVDSMDHTGGDLQAALTTFKSRARSQVRAAKIEMEWNQSDQLFTKFETTNGTLNVYRFMQEAFTNVIRHAQANKIRVEIYQEAEDKPLTIKIQDNGVGFDAEEKRKSGQGLINLQHRAAMVGGDVEFTTGIDGKGAGVELTIVPGKKQDG